MAKSSNGHIKNNDYSLMPTNAGFGGLVMVMCSPVFTRMDYGIEFACLTNWKDKACLCCLSHYVSLTLLSKFVSSVLPSVLTCFCVIEKAKLSFNVVLFTHLYLTISFYYILNAHHIKYTLLVVVEGKPPLSGVCRIQNASFICFPLPS